MEYHIKVDMVRSGFRLHETTSTIFYYLPRSIPTSLHSLTAAFEEVEAVKCDGEEDDVRWKIMNLTPVDTTSARGNSSILQVSIPFSEGVGFIVTN